MKKFLILVFSSALFLAPLQDAFSHCQIPCGIYDDQMRVEMIAEDIATIEKSINMIVELSSEKNKNYNQIVRWVNNKEVHADKISEVVTYYFMAQRIKLPDKKTGKQYNAYVEQLGLLHEILVLSMKAKQGLDLSNVEKLKEALHSFQNAYFKE